MTQEELAERSGLTARYIGAIERADVSARHGSWAHRRRARNGAGSTHSQREKRSF